MDVSEIKIGKIYSVSYGENTQLIGVISKIEPMKILFSSHLHYWNGSQTYYRNGYSVTSGITELRPASKAEKHHWFKKTLENDDI